MMKQYYYSSRMIAKLLPQFVYLGVSIVMLLLGALIEKMFTKNKLTKVDMICYNKLKSRNINRG